MLNVPLYLQGILGSTSKEEGRGLMEEKPSEAYRAFEGSSPLKLPLCLSRIENAAHAENGYSKEKDQIASYYMEKCWKMAIESEKKLTVVEVKSQDTLRELDEKRNLAMERLAELQVEGGKAMEIESEARAQEQIAGKKLRQLHKCKSNCLSLWLRLQDIFQELVGAKTLESSGTPKIQLCAEDEELLRAVCSNAGKRGGALDLDLFDDQVLKIIQASKNGFSLDSLILNCMDLMPKHVEEITETNVLSAALKTNFMDYLREEHNLKETTVRLYTRYVAAEFVMAQDLSNKERFMLRNDPYEIKEWMEREKSALDEACDRIQKHGPYAHFKDFIEFELEAKEHAWESDEHDNDTVDTSKGSQKDRASRYDSLRSNHEKKMEDEDSMRVEIPAGDGQPIESLSSKGDKNLPLPPDLGKKFRAYLGVAQNIEDKSQTDYWNQVCRIMEAVMDRFNYPATILAGALSASELLKWIKANKDNILEVCKDDPAGKRQYYLLCFKQFLEQEALPEESKPMKVEETDHTESMEVLVVGEQGGSAAVRWPGCLKEGFVDWAVKNRGIQRRSAEIHFSLILRFLHSVLSEGQTGPELDTGDDPVAALKCILSSQQCLLEHFDAETSRIKSVMRIWVEFMDTLVEGKDLGSGLKEEWESLRDLIVASRTAKPPVAHKVKKGPGVGRGRKSLAMQGLTDLLSEFKAWLEDQEHSISAAEIDDLIGKAEDFVRNNTESFHTKTWKSAQFKEWLRSLPAGVSPEVDGHPWFKIFYSVEGNRAGEDKEAGVVQITKKRKLELSVAGQGNSKMEEREEEKDSRGVMSSKLRKDYRVKLKNLGISREEARGHCERAAYVTLPTIMANQPQVKVLRFHNEEELGAWVTAHEILLHAEAQAAQDEQCRQSLEFLLKAHAISV